MKPTEFEVFAEQQGKLERIAKGQVFHTQDFKPKKLFLLKSGYVKRYQTSKPGTKVLELIYGPGHIISLSGLYKQLFAVDQNQDDFIYVYQTMTDVEMYSVGADAVADELERNPKMYKDFFYESGLKLRSNIARLASNSLKDNYQKVAHQIVSLAYEFAGVNAGDTRKAIELPLPQSALDIAEQLNVSTAVVETILDRLRQLKLITTKKDRITITDMNFLKDVYL